MDATIAQKSIPSFQVGFLIDFNSLPLIYPIQLSEQKVILRYSPSALLAYCPANWKYSNPATVIKSAIWSDGASI